MIEHLYNIIVISSFIMFLLSLENYEQNFVSKYFRLELKLQTYFNIKTYNSC